MPKCENTGFNKETDITDVWFDWPSHFAVLKRDNLRFARGYVSEGGDQFEGGSSPRFSPRSLPAQGSYKSCFTNGQGNYEGRKMSKLERHSPAGRN